MDVLAQIKEQLEHVKAYEAEVIEIQEKMQEIQERISKQKVYGTETAELNAYRAQIRQISEQIRKKEMVIKGLHQQRQQPLFL